MWTTVRVSSKAGLNILPTFVVVFHFKLTGFFFHGMVIIPKPIQQFGVIGGDGLKVVSVFMNHGLNKLLHTGAVVIENRHTIFNGAILTIGGVPTCLLANAHSELGPFASVNTKGFRTIGSR